MTSWFATWVPRILTFAGILSSAGTCARAADNLTGHYEAQPIKSCSSSELENSIGVTYHHHCFTGDAYGNSRVLQVVQNGKNICGTYTECGGFNCGKFYSGEIAGLVENEKLSLFWTNGHKADGPAEILSFRVVKGGLVDDSEKSSQPSLVKRSPTLKNSQISASCVPKFPAQVRLGSSGELNIAGMLQADQVGFTNLAQKKYASAPKTKRIVLVSYKPKIMWADVRAANNFVIRKLVLANTTKKPWTVEAEHPDTCREFLRSSYNKRKNLVELSDVGEHEIQPGQTVSVASCNGSVWRLAKTLPACPKFFCLKDCKC